MNYQIICGNKSKLQRELCNTGHGKRNGATHLTGTTSQKRSGAWYISRLFNPSIENPNKMAAYFNIPNQDNDEFEKFQKHGFQIYPISDSAENSPRFRDLFLFFAANFFHFGKIAIILKNEIVGTNLGIRTLIQNQPNGGQK